MPRGENKQLVINIIAQIGVFAISLCINFFLTPFIVKTLGVEAYGFVGLSNSIISYMQVITVALNSMAGRFITIEYHRGDLKKANQYFSSVFFANCIFGVVVLTICLGLLVYFEYIIVIPVALIHDVKWLFFLLSMNTVLTLVFNVFIVPPFIKKKLEITSVRNLVSTLLRLFLILFLFTVFSPKLWYLGLSALLCSIYLVGANIVIKRKLTPELRISKIDYQWAYIREILISGVWNLVNKISVILEKGFDLLLANWFINSFIMGLLSITAQITMLIPQVINLIATSFAPSITEYFAKDDMESLQRNVFKSMRIMSILVIMPLSVLYVYGDVFFSLWLPEQDSSLLHLIAILTTFDFIFGMPLEIFWSIFTATNKIKVPAITMVIVGFLTFTSLLVLLSAFNDPTKQLICLASARMFWNTIKNITFLPIYGAKCLNLEWNFFYKSMFKPILGIIISLMLCQVFHLVYVPNNWLSFSISSIMVVIVAVSIGGFFILEKDDIHYIASKLYISRNH